MLCAPGENKDFFLADDMCSKTDTIAKPGNRLVSQPFCTCTLISKLAQGMDR